MKKILLTVIFAVVMLSMSVAAVNGSIDSVSDEALGSGELVVSFDVTTDGGACAVVSSYDTDGRLLETKLVNVTASDGYSATLGNLNSIDRVQISLFEATSTLKPICRQQSFINYAKTGETDIHVGPLFK